MANPSQLPPAGPGGPPGDAQDGPAGGMYPALLALAAVIAGTALLGAATGFAWAAVAPRALIVVVGRGSADVVNPETSAFIAADGWFTLLTAVGGVISGLLGHALAVRKHGPLAMSGVLVGGAVAALIARWIGQGSGAAAFNQALAAGRPGDLLREPLMVGGPGSLAFWPIAAGLVAGGIEGFILLRERRQAPSPVRARAAPGYGQAVSPQADGYGDSGQVGQQEPAPGPEGSAG